MSYNIKTLLEELYTLEPSLREKEDSIIRIITEMQKNKPSFTIDEDFKRTLKDKVMHELLGKPQKTSWYIVFPILSWLSFAVFGFFFLQNIFPQVSEKSPIIEQKSLSKVSFLPSISPQKENAFGNSITLAQGNTHQNQTQWTSMPTAIPANSKMMVQDSVMMLPPQYMVYYTYTYTGSLPLTPEKLTVYKKKNGVSDILPLTTILSNFSLQNFDLSAFQNTQISNISFIENRDYGYSVNIDFSNLSLSLSENWTKWPQPKCDQNGCETQKPLTEKDALTDDEVARIGNTFLTKYGIDTSLYGKPKVTKNTMMLYARAESSPNPTLNTEIPEQYTLMYPLLLDGKEVYEEYGGYKGISMNIDTRTKLVRSMYGLEKQMLESSVYTTPTAKSTFENWMKYGWKYETRPLPDQKIVEISLDTPVLQYVHVYGEWKDGVSPEYYIPAYVFPVKKDATIMGYVPDQIIIPAVEEFAKIVTLSDTPIISPWDTSGVSSMPAMIK
jgi:hypothetical protein